MVRSVDTNVVVIGVGLFDMSEITELWMSFGTEKHHRYIAIHEIATSLGSVKSSSLPLFYALIGCDQVSFFARKVIRIG